MSFSKSETFDSATAPAMPAGWNTSSGLVVTSTTFPYSNPNALSTSSGTSNAPVLATWGTGDGSGSGSVAVTQSAEIAFHSGSPASDGWQTGITFRGNSSTLNNSSTSFYFVLAERNLIPGDSDKLRFGKIINGTATYITDVTLTGLWGSLNWYQIVLSLTSNGTSSNTITVYVIRNSDSFELGSDGNWYSSGQTAISSNDTSILTGQYYGTIQTAPHVDATQLDNWTVNSTISGGGGGALLWVPLDGLRRYSNPSGGMNG